MAVCEGASLSDLGSDCVRAFWGTILPAVFVLFLSIVTFPYPKWVSPFIEPIRATVQPFLTIAEAEALDATPAKDDTVEDAVDAVVLAEASRVPFWRTLVLSWLGLSETLVWLALGSYMAIQETEHAVYAARAFVTAVSWFYAAVRPIVRPVTTAPYDLFLLFLAHAFIEATLIGGIIYNRTLDGLPLPPAVSLAAHIVDLLVILVLLVIVLAVPVGNPSSRLDKQKIGTTISPEDYTTLWGWLSFSWVWPLIKKGPNSTLNEDDVWSLSPEMQSRPVHIKFAATKLDFVGTYASVILEYASPFFLRLILEATDHPTAENPSWAYIYALLAFVCSVARAEAEMQHLWYGRRASTRIRFELMAAIYDKALKRKDYSGIVDKDKAKRAVGKDSNDAKAGADVGKIVNLMSGDVNRMSLTTSAMYMLYGAPLEIILASFFLYQLLGWSAFAGFFVLLLGWPLNSFFSKQAIHIQKGGATTRDKRTGVLNELIGTVKFIKFFAWEDLWIQRALDAREEEMKWMIRARINNLMFMAWWACAPVFVSVVSFTVFVMRGNELTVSIAFTAIALFNLVRAPLNVIPVWIMQVLQTLVAVDRVATFLDEDEVDGQVSSLKKPPTGAYATDNEMYKGLGIKNGTFKWNEVEKKDEDPTAKKAANVPENTEEDRASLSADDHRFELKDVSIMFPEGHLTLVTGPTASGKTALLLALLGEMTTLNGRIIMRKDSSCVDAAGFTHSIAYAAQSPWLRHQSIKDNILFGYPCDENRYNQVVEACALNPDLAILEDRDATEIGARGVSLSGGQKARVALARAVYAPAKYLLLDDPLSAVDSHTARFLFENLFKGPLLTKRTVVLVTHHVELVLPGAHYLVRMLDGRVDTQGTVANLRTRGILDDIKHESEVEVRKEEEIVAKEKPPSEEVAVEGDGKLQDPIKKPRKLIKDKEREVGSVKWPIYKTYLKASSYWTWLILGFLVIVTQFLGVGEKAWIKIWGEAYAGFGEPPAAFTFSPLTIHHMDGTATPGVLTSPIHHFHSYDTSRTMVSLPPAQEHPLFYVGIYAAIGLLTALVTIISIITQYIGGLRASRVLFKTLLETVDVETVDSSLSNSLQNINTSFASFIASSLTVTIVFPAFLVPAFAMGWVYYALAIGYLNTGRDLRRMESNSLSPIFSGFGELLEGIVTVRAFSVEQKFLDNLFVKVDMTTKMWYNFWMTNRRLLLNFDVLGAAAVLVTTLFALSGFVSAGTAGFCITSAMSFTASIYWTCRFWTGLELDLNSVERVVEYLDLPQEPPAIMEDSRPPASWPSSDSANLIVVDDLVVKYALDLPPVLHNISFALKGRERVGLPGRTGSGKSTLAMSLLRFADPAGGKIFIDGTDITTIGIHDLRSRVTFIPQDATLFSGTLRENLDPFNEHDDAECLDVLSRVHLIADNAYRSQKSSLPTSRTATRPPTPTTGSSASASAAASVTVTAVTEIESKVPITLETQVSAVGTNFSQGQRQLIAMARALLRSSSIIILDEATSSIDFATDAKIQKTIREEFGGSLLLTVAHRLKTVIDYDRLIVLDKDAIAEFDTPYNLIRKEGIFRNMCLNSGMFGELEEAARAKAEGRGA